MNDRATSPVPGSIPKTERHQAAQALLRWYRRHRRRLPWREQPSAYRTLVSELMLQQTQVATVVPYFERFVARFPDFPALARASEDSVMRAWAGLGYYARARNLRRAARVVVEQHGGVLPSSETELRRLPGVGAYTAAAVAAIAFGARTFALDGNAARVVARLWGGPAVIDTPAARAALRACGQTLVPARGSGDFAQAVMELGARVCTTRGPACTRCVLRSICRARKAGAVDAIPAPRTRAGKRALELVCVVARRGDKVLMQRRPSGVLLGGTWAVPMTERPQTEPKPEALRALALVALDGSGLGLQEVVLSRAPVRHVFTHLDARAHVIRGEARGRLSAAQDGWSFITPTRVALSTFMRKVLSA